MEKSCFEVQRSFFLDEGGGSLEQRGDHVKNKTGSERVPQVNHTPIGQH